jgi:hypothetical protein
MSFVLGCFALAAAAPESAATLDHAWSRHFGSTDVDRGIAVAVDGLGNVFVTGAFTGTVDFGGGDLVSAGLADIFVAKYNAAGVHEWSKSFGGTSNDFSGSIAVDNAGNVLLTGYFNGTVDFGGGDLVSAGGLDVFVVKYSSAGVHQWSKRFGSIGDDYGFGVAVDGSGAVAVTGYFSGTVDFGGGDLVAAGGIDISVAKYNSAGVHQWSHGFGDGSSDSGRAIAVDGAGNVVVTGQFAGTVNFGGGNLVAAGDIDVFVAKYNSAGTHQWSERFGGTTADLALSLATDALADVLVAGFFQGTADFGGGELMSAGSSDIFVAKYNSAGGHQWSQRFGSISSDQGNSVTVDASGHVSLAGFFQDTVDFGGGDLVSAGSADIFVARFNPAGVHQCSERFGGASEDQVNSAVVDGSGSLMVTGYFSDTVDFGGGELVSEGGWDVFVAKYLREPPVAVLIQRFDVTAKPEGVRIEWDVASDANLRGFYLYRSSQGADKGLTRMQDAMLSAHARFFVDTSANAGETYWYRLGAVDDGGELYSPTRSVRVPTAPLTLGPVYPNPFNPGVTVNYMLPSNGERSLRVYDAQGRLVRTLVEGHGQAGQHEARWDGRDDSGLRAVSGVYLVTLRFEGTVKSEKIVLLK